MPKKLLSIIVPVFNEAKTIELVLQRLFALNISNYETRLNDAVGQVEIIVINDGSTDDTKKIITPYLNKIKYLEHEKNLGKGNGVRGHSPRTRRINYCSRCRS
ncbi:MAG: glycosyltransferase [Patescibacteria group bacterium]